MGKGRLLNPVVGDGEGGDSTGLSLNFPFLVSAPAGGAGFYLLVRTLPTRTLRPSSTDTHMPACFADWRLRKR